MMPMDLVFLIQQSHKHSIYMATLGKAAGVMGAFVAGDDDFIEFLIQKSRPYIYTTAIPPSMCQAMP